MRCKVPGIEEGVIYRKTEDLLRAYNSMQARIKNLAIDIAGLDSECKAWMPETQDETIAGMYFQRGQVSPGSGPPSAVSDKTANVAAAWSGEQRRNVIEVVNELYASREKSRQEMDALQSTVQKVDNAIASLSEDEQVIIRGFYLEHKYWYEIAYQVQYVERHCKRLRTRAIWYMGKSIFGVGVVKN